MILSINITVDGTQNNSYSYIEEQWKDDRGYEELYNE